VLFEVEGRYFIKADQQPMPITNVSCFADAVEHLLLTFFVFNVSYPHFLRLVYAFIEKALLLTPTVGKSTTVAELYHKCLRA
jgi:hypothetical protein